MKRFIELWKHGIFTYLGETAVAAVSTYLDVFAFGKTATGCCRSSTFFCAGGSQM